MSPQTNNVLSQAPIQKKLAPPSGVKISGIGILLTIVLLILLIALGERLFLDLNRSFNPLYDKCSTYRTDIYSTIKSQAQPSASTTQLKGGGTTPYGIDDVYYPTQQCDAAQYKLYEILLHAALTVPVLLGAMLLYFITHFRQERKYYKIIGWSYFIFAFWLTLHLVFELCRYLTARYQTWGIYVVLVLLVAILTWLIVFVQRKVNQARV